ncbi:MAG TPA: TetR/AcrR family transcriptional regulator [Streptosporangiaceae bacterium]|nr:TetR/AcrR family transcriptional regulator [Streptosporangiaceae bacterium]
MTADHVALPGSCLPIGGSALQRKLGNAAIELFYASGVMATSVREITAACGLTPGALYNHFSSKEDLLYVLVRDIHVQVDSAMALTLAEAGADPIDQLSSIVRFLVAHTAGFKKQSRFANREFTVLTGTRMQEIRAIRRRMRDRLAQILLIGAAQGAFSLTGGNDQPSAALCSGTILNMCVHISEWTLEHYPQGTADLQDRYVTMALRLAGATAERDGLSRGHASFMTPVAPRSSAR